MVGYGCGSRGQCQPADRLEVGGEVPRGGPSRGSGPLHRAEELPDATRSSHGEKDRLAPAPAARHASHRLAHGPRSFHRVPDPLASRPGTAPQVGAEARTIRYEWPNPGDLVHLDTKKLGRMGPSGGWRFDRSQKGRHARLGWTVVHVAVDDHSRLAYVEELPDERPDTTVAFLRRATDFYWNHGIVVRRVLTDNGNPYRSFAFRAVAAELEVRHHRTKPYTPRTNGKAEAMVKILLNGWAYTRPYGSDTERSVALDPFVDFYNHRRPHGGLNGARPIDRVRQ